MSDLVISRKLSKYDRKVFKKLQDLGKVKERFVIPEEKPKATAPKFEPSSFKEEIEHNVIRDEKAIKLMDMAVKHVRVYDSKETAVELMNRAYKACTSIYNRRLISNSTRSLKEAIKAEKWMQSKKRRKHVDKLTIEKNVTAFFEKLNDAVISIKVEIEKRTNKLFNRVKEEYTVDLPIELPESKSYIITKANIVAQCNTKPTCKHLRLESNLFLLENVSVIGVNIRKSNSSYIKAETIAEKRGCTVYDKILSRPSKNIHWYLLQNFGTSVNYATFSDSLQVSDAVDAEFSSYDEYVKIKEAKEKLKEQLKTRRLQEYRKKFEEENRPLYEDIKQLKIDLSNLVDLRPKMTEELEGLTSFEEEGKGLSPKSISKLDAFYKEFRDRKHYSEGVDYTEAVRLSIRQKIAAKTLYYDLKDLNNQISVIRSKIKFLEADEKKRKNNYALELGLVSMTKIVDM